MTRAVVRVLHVIGIATILLAACSDDDSVSSDADDASGSSDARDVAEDGESPPDPDDVALDVVDLPDDMVADIDDDGAFADADAEGVDLDDEAGGDASDASDEANDASDEVDGAPDMSDAMSDATDTGDAADSGPDASDDGSDVADASDISDVAPDGTDVVDTPSEPDGGPPANACKDAGGICVGSVADCTAGAGTHAPSGDVTCDFDDGSGACCVPPEAQPTGDSCQDRGGMCAPIAGCNFVDGSFAPPADDCESVPVIICCLTEKVCGEEDVVCCGATVAFRPTCDRGAFTCDLFPGTELVPIRDCDI